MKKAKKVPVRFSRAPIRYVKPGKKVRTTAERRRAAKLSWQRRKAKAELDKQFGPVKNVGLAEIAEKVTPAEAQAATAYWMSGETPVPSSDANVFAKIEHVGGVYMLIVGGKFSTATYELSARQVHALVRQGMALLPTP